MVFCAFGGNARGEGDKYSSEADIRDTEATKPSKQQQEAATHARENNTRASGRLHSEARTEIARAFNETRRESMQVQARFRADEIGRLHDWGGKKTGDWEV